jgi:hypothetical protein
VADASRQDDLAAILAGPTQGPQTIDHARFKPDQPLALLVGLVFEADTTERQRPGDCLERGLSDWDADHKRQASSRRRILITATKKACRSPNRTGSRSRDQSLINPQHDSRADHRDDDAPEIEAGDPAHPK